MNRPLVETLQQRPDLSVITKAGRIAIVRFGQIIPEAERAEFYLSAREIADRLCDSGAAVSKDGKPRDAEAVEAIQQMGGIMGRMLRQNLVTAEQVDEFQAQAIPRTIPKNIARCVYGSSGFLMLWGGFAWAIGATLVTCLLMSSNKDLEGEMWFVPYALIVIPIIGAIALFFAGKYRLARRRLLNWGACEPATVLKVASTHFIAGNDTLHRLTFQTGRGETTTLVGSGHAERARRVQASGATVTVLVDSAKPSKVLWVGGWAANAD